MHASHTTLVVLTRPLRLSNSQSGGSADARVMECDWGKLKKPFSSPSLTASEFMDFVRDLSSNPIEDKLLAATHVMTGSL